MIPRPVDLVRDLVARGLSLRKAHETLDRIAAGETVAIELLTKGDNATVDELARRGVLARTIQVPIADPKRVREKFGLSQTEFATRFGLEPDTLRNWEQGRNTPDSVTRILLKLIETNPSAVESVLQARNPPAAGKRPAGSI